MALQTTGLEFFYLSVDFSENDKILLVERYTIKTKDILSYMGIIIDITILSNIHRNR